MFMCHGLWCVKCSQPDLLVISILSFYYFHPAFFAVPPAFPFFAFKLLCRFRFLSFSSSHTFSLMPNCKAFIFFDTFAVFTCHCVTHLISIPSWLSIFIVSISFTHRSVPHSIYMEVRGTVLQIKVVFQTYGLHPGHSSVLLFLPLMLPPFMAPSARSEHQSPAACGHGPSALGCSCTEAK